MPAVELTVNLIEQPSPVSVLDTAFYIEDSPSPVKKISTAFQGIGLFFLKYDLEKSNFRL